MGNAAKDQFKAQLPLNDIKIVDVADTDEVQNACEVQPKKASGKFHFKFVFNTPEEKAEWVKEIKTLVREFQLKDVKAAKEAKELGLSPQTTEVESSPESKDSRIKLGM